MCTNFREQKRKRLHKLVLLKERYQWQAESGNPLVSNCNLQAAKTNIFYDYRKVGALKVRIVVIISEQSRPDGYEYGDLDAEERGVSRYLKGRCQRRLQDIRVFSKQA